jgi:hypothetical protein
MDKVGERHFQNPAQRLRSIAFGKIKAISGDPALIIQSPGLHPGSAGVQSDP